MQHALVVLFFCSLSVFAVSTRYIFVQRTFSYRFGTLTSLKLGLNLSDYGSYFQKVNRYHRVVHGSILCDPIQPNPLAY